MAYKPTPKNQVRHRNKIEQHEHCDDADARRVKVVLSDGTSVTSDDPFPVEVSGIDIGDVDISVQLSRVDNTRPHDSVRIGSQSTEWDFKECDPATGFGEGRVVDTLHCGGTSTVIEVFDTPIVVKVAASSKVDRKCVFLQPRAKGLYWGFNNNVDSTDGVTGGAPLFKNQPAEFSIEANTPLYIVGPASGVKVFIAEA